MAGLQKLHDSYRAVFTTPDGEEILKHLCKIGYVFDTSYVVGDSHETAHREGQRRLVLSILRFVGRDPKDILAMIQGEENV